MEKFLFPYSNQRIGPCVWATALLSVPCTACSRDQPCDTRAYIHSMIDTCCIGTKEQPSMCQRHVCLVVCMRSWVTVNTWAMLKNRGGPPRPGEDLRITKRLCRNHETCYAMCMEVLLPDEPDRVRT